MGNWRCRACKTSFRPEKVDREADACPQCGCEAPPLDEDMDIELDINWFYLRCLANWAMRWVETIEGDPEVDQTLERILSEIRDNRPEGAAALTFYDEVRELRESGLEVIVEHPDEER